MSIENVSTYIIILKKEDAAEVDRCREYFKWCGRPISEYELLTAFVKSGLEDWRNDLEDHEADWADWLAKNPRAK